jgi:uncharacterized membrane protein YfcA
VPLTPGTIVWLIAAGLVAGFIDSIAGGGGLITLPTLAAVVGPGADAIGTNKIVGTAGALAALIVYAHRGHVDWSRAISFSLWVAIGSFAGSRVEPLIPTRWFGYFLAATCPLILWVVWQKDLWIQREGGSPTHAKSGIALAAAGIGCGFYDGVWGPGGGTFMFLSLFFFAKLPLLVAIAASKVANTASAGTSLVSYWLQGRVHPIEGLIMGAGIALGGLVGANHATTRAARIVRPILVVVVGLLIVKLLTQFR